MTLPELVKTKKYNALKPPHYLDVYQHYLKDKQYSELKIMEVGIAKGGSLKLWRDYFLKAQVFGIDGNSKCVKLKLGQRIKTFWCNQNDVDTMKCIGGALGPFDLVIDDGAHMGLASLNTFIALFPCVAPGGLYVIEDWGTGYWEHWPDGKTIENEGNFTYEGEYPKLKFPSHQWGMVGFVKQLIDLCNTLDRTQGKESSQINSMEILPGMVLLRKRTNA